MNSNLEEVINELEATLLIFKDLDIDNKKFELEIKLGDLIEKSGDIDRSLKYFKSAYDTAMLLKNKIYQVDALVKITEGYFYKGEIEESIKYAEIVEEILGNIDYVKGRLDISLYLLKVYHIKNEYYKAREIGNEALKLCTDEYIFYKGRILNSLASLYGELTSVDEHLDLLKQSLSCFEKAHSLRGILGVLNNIGAVYAEKLQDNEKALEYFFKLKQRSEDSDYLEFNVYAHVNIAETYFKCLKYEEALHWCNLGLEKAKKAHLEAVIFYSYVILSNINRNLYNYKEAYVNFNLACNELKTYPDQGVRLPWFYKATASLFLEFGDLPKAKYNIKLALDILGDEQSIIKWNTGMAYEFIKLKEAKNKMEILASLEGITYILSKYKNSEVISNIVYDVALELMDLDQRELAFKFVNEHKYLPVANAETRLKHKYIGALSCNNEEKEQKLNSALEFAIQFKNNKLHLKISSSLGEYYAKVQNYEKAIIQYLDACRQIKKILISIPEEFRIQFVNSTKILPYFNTLVRIKQDYFKDNDYSYTKYHCINNGNELKDFFKELDKITSESE